MHPLRICILAAALAGIPLAGQAAGPPHRDQGVALMGAFVLFNGNLQSGVGVIASERVNTGVYTVTFDREISFNDCFFAAGGVMGRHSVIPVAVQDRDTLLLSLHNEGGETSDGPFQIVAFCAR
jgi:hypothetical protein